ncbi:MAG: ligand-binding sensor domain-containing protein, partial [Gemmatimonadales bacterium]
MRRWCARLVFVLVAGCLTRLDAQRYSFRQYGQQDGLNNLMVRCLLEDRAGFLWVGTENGLFRYDGREFVEFTMASGLPGARIESLHETTEGRLWVGTRLGAAVQRGDRFDPATLGTPYDIVSQHGIAADGAGRVFVATNRGLAVFPPGGLGGRLLDRASGVPPEAHAVHVDRSGEVWLGCGTSLCRVERDRVVPAGVEGLPAQIWRVILSDPQGALWVRSALSLQFRLKGASRFQAAHGDFTTPLSIITLAADREGQLLAPTRSGFRMGGTGGWRTVDVRQGLASDTASCALADREGSVWIGFAGAGLTRWLGYQEWESWTRAEGLASDNILSVVRDASGTMWAATSAGLV